MADIERNVRTILQGLVGKEIRTISGKPNRVLRLENEDVIVATSKSPGGQPVPIAEVQLALNRLLARGEIEISVPSVGYRSAFVGAVLASLPETTTASRPEKVFLRKD